LSPPHNLVHKNILWPNSEKYLSSFTKKIKKMEINNFFDKVSSASTEDGSGIIKTLFEFSKAINKMSDDDLIAFYQALTMLRKAQPLYWFKENKLVANIAEVQKIVIQAMKVSVQKKFDTQSPTRERIALQNRFRGAVGFDV
jgi:hypothetical protein